MLMSSSAIFSTSCFAKFPLKYTTFDENTLLSPISIFKRSLMISVVVFATLSVTPGKNPSSSAQSNLLFDGRFILGISVTGL